MTYDERALLLAVAKYIVSSLDAPFVLRRQIQDLVRAVTPPNKE